MGVVRFQLILRHNVDTDSVMTGVKGFAPLTVIVCKSVGREAVVVCEMHKEAFEDFFDAELRWVGLPMMPAPGGGPAPGMWEAVVLPKVPNIFKLHIKEVKVVGS